MTFKTTTNRTMSESPDFRRICEANGVKPTKRQFSKFTNRYGQLASATGISTRQAPPGPKHRGWHKWTNKDETGKVVATKWYEDAATRIG